MTPKIAAEIFQLLKAGVHTHDAIADLHNISTRTVARIQNGESWNEITGLPKKKRSKEPPPKKDVDDKIFDKLDSKVALCNHFGFDNRRPLAKGWFDAWDGKIYVVTDGVIAWVSKALFKFVEDTDELAYFSLAELLDQPVGQPLQCITLFEEEGIACLNDLVFLDIKFVKMARNQGLTIRQVADRLDYVFLVKARSKTTADAFSEIHAAVATLRDY